LERSNYLVERSDSLMERSDSLMGRRGWNEAAMERSDRKLNRQSMTVCGYCCYHLKHCSKTNHIAIKRAKYENVFRLEAH